ncbi:MAG: glycosyltransferase [Dysgonomonas sp.]
MKIAHISTARTGGAGIAAYRIHQGLLKYGKDIESDFVQKLENPDPESHFYRCTHYHDFYYRVVSKLGFESYLTQEGRYKRIISSYPSDYEIVTYPVSYYPIEDHPIVENADIIHLHWVGQFLNYPSFFKKIKQPVVWTLHDPNPSLGLFHYEEDQQRNVATLGKLDKEILYEKGISIHKKNNLFIACPSEWVKKKSEASINLKRYPHYLIPYGIEALNYPLLDKKESKLKLNIDNERKNILFVAHNIDVYRKGIDLLIGALNGVDPSLYNLIAIGGGNLNFGVDEKINLITLNHISDIAELNIAYSAADVTIVPSREDMFNQVMLESLINGTPVISFSNGGMAEHIRTGENGILVDEINSEALKNAINNFLENKYNFDRTIIREYPIQHLSSRLQTERYIDLYNQILKK